LVNAAEVGGAASTLTDRTSPRGRVFTRRARLGELDALRGLGAIAVSLQHVLVLTGAAAAILQLATLTPLNALIDGTRAVLLFFVLSGFVLALPFYRGPVSPVGFILKRAARLYPAYWVALAASIAVFSIDTDTHLNAYALANFASLLTEYDAQKYNVVFWSLVQEMRLSLLFPLIMVLVVRLPTRWILGLSAIFVATGFAGEEQPGGPIIGLAATAFYAFFFVLGALTAKHLDRLTALIIRLPGLLLACWLVVTLGVYGAFPTIGVAVPVEKAVIGVASASLIVLALGWADLSRVLRAPPFHFVGMVSYSYYLLHVPISELVYRLTGGPGLIAAGVTVAAGLVIAWMSFKWIEMPGIAVGHQLYARIAKRRLPPREAATAAT
jgi:peptidoglycan/LPS O-acetylase OafA/YrhL